MAASSPTPDRAEIPSLQEEFDSPKRTLPPAAPIILAIFGVGLVLVLAAWLLRSKPVVQGGIDDIFAVEVPNQHSSLVAVQVHFTNTFDKTLVLREVTLTARGGWGESSDTSVPGVDFPRYAAAFPALKPHLGPPLLRESNYPPGAEGSGAILVALPLTQGDIEARKNLSVTLTFYDHPAVELKK